MDEPGGTARQTGTEMPDARPTVDPVERAVARSRVEAALFGEPSERPRVGRHHLLERVGAGGMGVVYAAYDPELDRAVAIKLVQARTARARERLLAEGQALARLAHPNVVPVFDVGLHGEDVYLVMELVRGEPLRARQGTARELVRLYRQAGEGLAAAHRAGIVHRDFKPDNAVIGRDGRVRVLDFGLAVRGDGDAEAGPAGTPRYMAPEQRQAGALTAAADQYAFCVSLREALGATPPRWIEPILARGCHAEPASRFPSMEALLAALARDPAVRRRNLALVAVAIAAGVAVFALGRAASDAPAVASCDGDAAIAGAWDREALRARLAGDADPYARQVADRIVGRLDDYAAGWATAYRASCRAHQRGEQSAELHDRRIACLARGRAALAATAEVLGSGALRDTIVALDGLPDTARCADPRQLLDRIAPPDAAIAARVTAVSADLERAQVRFRAARPDAGDAAEAALADARATGYAPLIARALLLVGQTRMPRWRRADAIAPLAEAAALAIEVGDDALAVEAYARRAWVEATSGAADPDLVLAGMPLVEALVRRLDDEDAFARALFHNNVAAAELARGRPDAAIAAYERALVDARAARGAGAIELAKIPAHLARRLDDPARRAALFDESTRRLSAVLGEDHPMTLDVRILAGMSADDPAAARALLEPACATYVRLHPQLPDGAECWYEVAFLAAAGDERAAAAMEAAVAAGAALPEPPPRVALAGAYLALARGDARGAAARFDRLGRELAVADDAAWWLRLLAAEAELGLGEARRALGAADAAARLEAAVTALESIAQVQPGPAVERRLARARAAARR